MNAEKVLFVLRLKNPFTAVLTCRILLLVPTDTRITLFMSVVMRVLQLLGAIFHVFDFALSKAFLQKLRTDFHTLKLLTCVSSASTHGGQL